MRVCAKSGMPKVISRYGSLGEETLIGCRKIVRYVASPAATRWKPVQSGGPCCKSPCRGCWNAVRKISDFPVHRAFARVEVEIGRCEVCRAGKAVYRSREAQAKVCEVRRFAGPEHEHRRCEGCYARLVREWNKGEGVR